MSDLLKEAEEFFRQAKINKTQRPKIKKLISIVSYKEEAKIMVDFLNKMQANGAEKVDSECNLHGVIGQSEQLVCSCGSTAVKTKYGIECTNAKCNL